MKKDTFRKEVDSCFLNMNALGLVTLFPDGHKACMTALSSASPHRSKKTLISSFSSPHNTAVMFEGFKQSRAFEWFKHLKPINTVH